MTSSVHTTIQPVKLSAMFDDFDAIVEKTAPKKSGAVDTSLIASKIVEFFGGQKLVCDTFVEGVRENFTQLMGNPLFHQALLNRYTRDEYVPIVKSAARRITKLTYTIPKTSELYEEFAPVCIGDAMRDSVLGEICEKLGGCMWVSAFADKYTNTLVFIVREQKDSDDGVDFEDRANRWGAAFCAGFLLTENIHNVRGDQVLCDLVNGRLWDVQYCDDLEKNNAGSFFNNKNYQNPFLLIRDKVTRARGLYIRIDRDTRDYKIIVSKFVRKQYDAPDPRCDNESDNGYGEVSEIEQEDDVPVYETRKNTYRGRGRGGDQKSSYTEFTRGGRGGVVGASRGKIHQYSLEDFTPNSRGGYSRGGQTGRGRGGYSQK